MNFNTKASTAFSHNDIETNPRRTRVIVSISNFPHKPLSRKSKSTSMIGVEAVSRAHRVAASTSSRGSSPGTFAFWNPCANRGGTLSLVLFLLSGSQPVDHSVAFGPRDVKSRTVFPVGLRDKRISCLPRAERSLRRKDSFFGGGLRQAKRTFRHAMSNAEKTLLYVKSQGGRKGCARTRRVPATRCSTWTRNGIPWCIHMYYGRPGQRKTRWFLTFADFSDLDRSQIDLRSTMKSPIPLTRLAYIYFDLQYLEIILS